MTNDTYGLQEPVGVANVSLPNYPAMAIQDHRTPPAPAVPMLGPSAIDHGPLINGLNTFYQTLIDLDYFRPEEFQFAPHDASLGKLPFATAAIEAAGLTDDAKFIIEHLPYLIATEEVQGWDEVTGWATTSFSAPVSYLDAGKESFEGEYGERQWGWADEYDGEVQKELPPWAVLVLYAKEHEGSNVVYDTRNGRITEYDFYASTLLELESQSQPTAELLEDWIKSLRTLDWIPWRFDDGHLTGMHPRPHRFVEQTLAHHDRLRQECWDRYAHDWPRLPSPSFIGPTESPDKEFYRQLDSYKSSHNQYWSKRRLFEQAGWPDELNKGFLRKSIQAWEDGLEEAMRVGKASVVVDEVVDREDWRVRWEAEREAEGRAEREFYREAAGEYGV